MTVSLTSQSEDLKSEVTVTQRMDLIWQKFEFTLPGATVNLKFNKSYPDWCHHTIPKLSKERNINTESFCWIQKCIKQWFHLNRFKTRKRLKELFPIGWNRTKRENFRWSPLFQTTYNIKTEKQTINSTYLASVGCGRLAEVKGLKTLL